MAEKAYNYGKYNKSLYDNLQYDEASATIAQTSSASATGDILDSGRATISAVSNFAATGVKVNGGFATIAQTSGFTADSQIIFVGVGHHKCYILCFCYWYTNRQGICNHKCNIQCYCKWFCYPFNQRKH